MGSTDFRVLIETILNKSNIKSELQEVQKIVKQNTIDITPELRAASLKNQLKKVSQEIANDFNKTFSTALTGTDIFKGYDNQAKQVIKENQLIQKSFTDLRKEAYQSANDRDPVFDKMAQHYREEEIAIQALIDKEKKLADEKKKLADRNALQGSKIDYSIEVGDNMAKIAQLTQKVQLWGDETDQVKLSMNGVNSAYTALQNSHSDEDKIANAKELKKQYDLVENKLKQLSVTDISPEKRLNFSNKMETWLSKNTNAASLCGKEIQDLIIKCKTCNSVEFNDLKSQFDSLTNQARAADKLGKSLPESFKTAAASFGQWIGVTTVLMGVFNTIKKMGVAVFDVDTAMTNLYKVTDVTNAKYTEFLDNANRKAQILGRSVSSLVEQSAKWAKLGFNIDDSAELAEISSIYANVGEVDDDTAVNDIVTAMKSFNIEASKGITVIDKFNKLGNEFATDAAGLGDGLKNSASALSLAGNDIDQSLAMITGMTEITQNASESGNAVKILSMRLRGMKGELEALGEDTTGIESISKIQTQLLNLSDNTVNIFDDQGNFRSTYDIIKDISDVWEKMSQVDQAQMLELIAGKQRGNSIAALIKSFQSGQTQKALNASMSSEGSAYEEQARWMESLEAKTQQFEAAFQSLSQTIVSSDFLKGMVDSGTGLINIFDSIIDKTGILIPLGTAATAIWQSGRSKERFCPLRV